jgi:hypothetical protein
MPSVVHTSFEAGWSGRKENGDAWQGADFGTQP